MRSGAHALSLLAVPLNIHVLQALEEEPRSLIDLRRAVGSPPQTTVRSHLHALDVLGVVERNHQPGIPGSVGYEIGAAGAELLAVADVVRVWLEGAPGGPLQLGSVAAKSTIKALTEGWSSAIVRAIAAGPLSLTELDQTITILSYPSLERRFGALRLAGLIKPSQSTSRGTPYGATDWLRRAVAPLAAAACWEGRHSPAESVAVDRIDVEAAFLLTVPLMELDSQVDGSCRLAIRIEDEGGQMRLAGVVVRVTDGRVVSCVSRLEGQVGAWVVGSARTWIDALIRRDGEELEMGGDRRLALTLVDAMQRSLPRTRQLA